MHTADAKPVGHRIQKGEITNPGGRPKVPATVKAIQALAREEVMRTISTVLLLDMPTFERMIANPSNPAQALICSMLTKAIELGCPVRTQFLLNYVLGKPDIFRPDPTPAGGDIPNAADILKGVPSSVLLEMVKGASAAAPFQAEGD